MKRLGIIALALVVGVFVALPVLRFLSDQGEEERAVEPTPVVLATPLRSRVEDVSSYPGRLAADSTVRVFPKVAGTATTVHVEENDVVAAGELLISLDDETQRLQMQQAYSAWQAAEAQYRKAGEGARPEELENARASLRQSERDLEKAQANLNRQRSLFEAGSISRAQLEAAENQLSGARTQVENARRSLQLLETGARREDVLAAQAQAESARKQYELARLQLRRTEIRAPVGGTVVSVATEAGNSVGPQAPVAVIVNDALMYARITVPERDYGQLSGRAGSVTARVRPLAYEDMDAVSGRLTSVSRVIDPESRTFSAEVAVENGSGTLRPGMYVEVDLVLEARERALLVPSTAVVERNGRSVVFIAQTAESGRPGEAGSVAQSEGLTARSVPVATGLRTAGGLEITAGLAGGERVVIEGNAFLEDGQPIRVLSGGRDDGGGESGSERALSGTERPALTRSPTESYAKAIR